MEVVHKIFNYLLDNYALYMVVIMGVLIMFINTILMFVKKPIKKLTSKIVNERLRKFVNKMFILFAFGLSALGWFVLNKISAHYFPYEEMKVFLTGAFSIVIYALGDGIVNKSEAVQLVETIKDFSEDEKEKTEEKETAEAVFRKMVK